MALPALALLLALPAQEPTSVHAVPRAGVQLTHPKSWTKRSRGKDITVYGFKAPSGGTVDLEISTSAYRGTPEEWKTFLTQVAAQQKRTIVGHEDGELLGVPLVRTTTEYMDGPQAKTLLTGILFTRTVEKFTFRMMANRADFADAKVILDPVIQSLRTFDGKLPEAESPGTEAVKPTENDKPPAPPPKPRILSEADKAPAVIVSRSEPQTLGATKIVVMADRPAVYTSLPESTINARLENLDFRLRPSVPIDSTSAQQAFAAIAARELDDFDEVTMREDHLPARNRVGATVASVLRVGKKGAQGMVRYLYLIDGGTAYGIGRMDFASYDEFKAQRKTLERVIGGISIAAQVASD